MLSPRSAAHLSLFLFLCAFLSSSPTPDTSILSDSPPRSSSSTTALASLQLLVRESGLFVSCCTSLFALYLVRLGQILGVRAPSGSEWLGEILVTSASLGWWAATTELLIQNLDAPILSVVAPWTSPEARLNPESTRIACSAGITLSLLAALAETYLEAIRESKIRLQEPGRLGDPEKQPSLEPLSISTSSPPPFPCPFAVDLSASSEKALPTAAAITSSSGAVCTSAALVPEPVAAHAESVALRGAIFGVALLSLASSAWIHSILGASPATPVLCASAVVLLTLLDFSSFMSLRTHIDLHSFLAIALFRSALAFTVDPRGAPTCGIYDPEMPLSIFEHAPLLCSLSRMCYLTSWLLFFGLVARIFSLYWSLYANGKDVNDDDEGEVWLVLDLDGEVEWVGRVLDAVRRVRPSRRGFIELV